MACLHCGFKLREDDKYCPNCGARAEMPAAARPGPVSAAPQVAPPAPAGDAPAALPVLKTDPGPKQADPALSRAREDFIKEFVATLPSPEEPAGKKPGQVLLALSIILCSAVEILIIGDIIISVFGVGPPQWRFSPVYAVSALICVALIELALILSVSVIRHKKREAARSGPGSAFMRALPPARIPAASDAGPPPFPADRLKRPPAPAPEAEMPLSAPPEESGAYSGEPLSANSGADAPGGASEAGAVQVLKKTEGPFDCKMTFTLRGEQKTVVFSHFPAVIGRDIIPDGTVSQVHCALNVAQGVMTIRDAESANGVYVNGIRISAPTVIEKNDRVIIGRASVRFELA